MKISLITLFSLALMAFGCSRAAEQAPPAGPGSETADDAAKPIGKTAAPDPNAVARAETDEYVVEVREAADMSVGMDTKVEVVVIPKGDFHFNLEFPTSVAVSASPGVSIDKAHQSLGDAVKKDETNGAAWDVAMTMAAPGTMEFKCDLKFLVCTDVLCDPQTATLAWKVDVQ